jgi:hypothetical protein
MAFAITARAIATVTAMHNPILDFVLSLVDEGLHPSVVIVENNSGRWQCRVELDDWCALGDGGADAVTIDRSNFPDGVSARGRERFAARLMPLELPSRTDVDSWVRAVAVAGIAPDVAWIGGSCLTKPINWLREPLRSALLGGQL